MQYFFFPHLRHSSYRKQISTLTHTHTLPHTIVPNFEILRCVFSMTDEKREFQCIDCIICFVPSNTTSESKKKNKFKICFATLADFLYNTKEVYMNLLNLQYSQRIQFTDEISFQMPLTIDRYIIHGYSPKISRNYHFRIESNIIFH